MSEEITERYHVRRREFLNEDPGMPGFIIGIVEDTRAVSDDHRKHWSDGEIVLDLGDCTRRVSFYFSVGDAAERENSLRKINLIAEVVNAVRDGMILEAESISRRPAEVETQNAEAEPATIVAGTANAETQPGKTEETRAQFSTSYITTLGL